MVPNLPPQMPAGMPPGMPQGMPPEMMGMAGMNPAGGAESPVCPCCGQPMPMPFNNTNAPQVPIDPRLLSGADMAQPAGNPLPPGNPLIDALMGGGGQFGNMR